jgi:hypothetical protein
MIEITIKVSWIMRIRRLLTAIVPERMLSLNISLSCVISLSTRKIQTPIKVQSFRTSTMLSWSSSKGRSMVLSRVKATCISTKTPILTTGGKSAAKVIHMMVRITLTRWKNTVSLEGSFSLVPLINSMKKLCFSPISNLENFFATKKDVIKVAKQNRMMAVEIEKEMVFSELEKSLCSISMKLDKLMMRKASIR